MRTHALSRGRLVAVCVLGMLASIVPTASADTALPVWTCRASAAYVEVNPLLAGQRVEPVLANGFPNRNTPDREMCSNDDTGLQTISLPPNTEAPLLTLEAASASTRITPVIGAARDQTVDADAGIAETVRVNLVGLVIDVEAVTATARGTCVGTTPTLTSSSRIVGLTINGTPILDIPQGGQGPLDINLGLIRIRLNQEQIVTAPNGDRTLTRQAAHIELLPAVGTEPLARVVLGEVKVDFHGAVCAPPPPDPVCPPNTVAQQSGGSVLVCAVILTRCLPGQVPGNGSLGNPPGCVAVCPEGTSAEPGQPCVRTVTNTVNVPTPVPCPADSIADPNRGGACVITVQSPPVNCPTGTTRDPATNNCILVRERPCPEGATPDPATRVCVATRVNNIGSGENGRIGSPDGPVATCGRLEMHFVRGFRNVGRSFTSRFGNRTVTRGRLVTCGSNPRPIIGARVDVVHVLPGNKRRRKTGLRSRAQGRLTLILPIDLRTRSIEYAYRPDLRSTRVTSRVTLRLTVKNRAGRTLR